jgi:ABC-2 type transport system permease protein
MSEFVWQAHAALVVAKKNAMVYYLKPPVFTFGIIFPFFFYLAFAAGHNAPPETMAPGIVAMALFFTASAVGPLVTPWERQAKTYERLITSPASLIAILSGDVLAGTGFGALLALLPLTIASLATAASVVAPLPLALGIVLGSLSFAALGVLLAAPAPQGPSQAPLSPLSYCADLIRAGFGEAHYWSTFTDVLALCAFIIGFMLLAARWHRRTRDRAV